MEVTFLGTGTSHGIPVVACGCNVCNSDNIKNKRYRSSIYIKTDHSRILIDAATEFRLQAIRENINFLDFVLITHAHADHVHGLDDLRTLSRKKKLNVYGNRDAVADMEQRFSYIHRAIQKGGGIPDIDFITLDTPIHHCSETGRQTASEEVGKNSKYSDSGDIIIPIPVKHGKLDIYGYRIDNFAYITDCSHIPEGSMKLLEGVEVLTLGALRYREHITHFTIDQAVSIIKKTGARFGYLTHFCHDIEHEKLKKELPSNIRPAYDSMKIYL